MTVRRVAALAQALTMITLLAPGPFPFDAAPVRAALQRPAPGTEARPVFDATGRGIGCQPRRDRFRGPTAPRDPPWPPGAEPTPSPEPSPSAVPSSDGPLASPPLEEGLVGTAFVQAELAPGASPPPGGVDADIAPDVPSRRGQGRSAFIRGIDVSHHNDDIDFAKVRDAGYDFVFIKATQDNDFVDPMFVTNMARARAAGLAAGGYHFFDYTLDGRVQADHFVDRLELADAIDDALPPVVDVECWAPIGSSTHAVSTARLRDFVARVYERTGRLPIIYTSVFMWREVVGNATGFEEQPLWAACWGCAAPPSLAPGWERWAFWQTGTDRVRGVKRLDGNVFSGTVEDLRAMRLRPIVLAAGAPATASRDVELDLGGRDATHLRTSADGETWTRWRPIRSSPRATIGSEEGSHMLHVQLRHGDDRPSPVYTDTIALDLTGPVIGTPTARLALRPVATGDDAAPASTSGDAVSIPVDVAWQASDEPAGLGPASLEVGCGEGPVHRIDVPAAADPGVLASLDATAPLAPGEACTITVAGSDGAGNTSRSHELALEATLHPATPDAAGAATLATDAGQVGIVARRGPDGGALELTIDGESAGSIDLVAPEASAPEIVYVADLTAGEPHTISVAPTSGSVEAFATLTTG